MTCHICLSSDNSKTIDRLDLCTTCYKEVTKRLEEYEKNEKEPNND